MKWAIIILIPLSLKAETVSRELLSDLHRIRSEIKKAVFEKSRYQQDILKSEIDIESKKQELLKVEADANEIKEKILERISNLYKIRRAYPQGNWLSMSIEENFIRKSYYLKYLNEQDKKLIADFKGKTEESLKLKNRVEEYRHKLVDLQKNNELRFAELAKQEKKQRELIREIREVVKSQQLNHANISADKKFFSEIKGELDLPLSGTLVGELGLIRDAKTNLTGLKTGLMVLATPGADVKTVFDGEVVHADNLDGWGPTIIVDHGESYYSVYSRLKNLSVRLGDRVITQQKLAEVSSLAYYRNKEPGLYFELRHFSEPEDPRDWLKGVKK